MGASASTFSSLLTSSQFPPIGTDFPKEISKNPPMKTNEYSQVHAGYEGTIAQTETREASSATSVGASRSLDNTSFLIPTMAPGRLMITPVHQNSDHKVPASLAEEENLQKQRLMQSKVNGNKPLSSSDQDDFEQRAHAALAAAEQKELIERFQRVSQRDKEIEELLKHSDDLLRQVDELMETHKHKTQDELPPRQEFGPLPDIIQGFESYSVMEMHAAAGNESDWLIKPNCALFYQGFDCSSDTYKLIPSKVIFLRPKYLAFNPSRGINIPEDWDFIPLDGLKEDEFVALISYRWAESPRPWKFRDIEGVISLNAFAALRFAWCNKMTIWIDCLSIRLSGHTPSEAFQYMGALYTTFPVASQLLWKFNGWAENYMLRGWMQQEILLSRLIVPSNMEDALSVFPVRHGTHFGHGDVKKLPLHIILAMHRCGLLGFDDENRPHYHHTTENTELLSESAVLIASLPTIFDACRLLNLLSLQYLQAKFEKESDRLFGIFGAYCALFPFFRCHESLLCAPDTDGQPIMIWESACSKYTHGMYIEDPIELFPISMGPDEELAWNNLISDTKNHYIMQCVVYAYWTSKTNTTALIMSLYRGIFDSSKTVRLYRCTGRVVIGYQSTAEDEIGNIYPLFQTMSQSIQFHDMERDHAEGSFLGTILLLKNFLQAKLMSKEIMKEYSIPIYHEGKIYGKYIDIAKLFLNTVNPTNRKALFFI